MPSMYIVVILSFSFTCFLGKVKANDQTNYLVFNIGSSIKKIDLGQLEGGIINNRDAQQVYDDEHRKAITAMAFDCETHSIFYAVNKIGIYKIGINGELKKPMAEGNYVVEGMSVDWVNRNLYWSESINPRIMVSTISPQTTFREIVKLSADPSGVLVIPKRKLLIWATNHDSKIEMSDLHGRARKVIYKNPQGMFYGLASNVAGDRIFWSSRIRETIKSASLANLPAGMITDPIDELINHHGPWSTGIAEWNGVVFWRSYIGGGRNPVSRVRSKNQLEEHSPVTTVHEEFTQGKSEDKYGAIIVKLATCPYRG